MAIVSKSSNTWIFSLKLLLLSTAVLTTAVFLKLSVPVAVQFTVSVVPVLWNSLLMWLTPPYLYVVINFIIITIAASSMYQQKVEPKETDLLHPVVPLKGPVVSQPDFTILSGYDVVLMKNPVDLGYNEAVVLKSPVDLGYNAPAVVNSLVNDIRPVCIEFEVSESPNVYRKEKSPVKAAKSSAIPVVASDSDFDDFVINRSAWAPIRRETKQIPSELFFTEKPPASVRFGHRKPVKASPEGGRTLGVSKPKRHDTLESTWKTITDGRPIPLARHLKKSDTWERHHENFGLQEKDTAKIKKSETFHEQTKKNNPTLSSPSSQSQSSASGKLKRESSLSQDELNRRVEAFIKKFNEDMRLQRQESLNQYNEMVKRN